MLNAGEMEMTESQIKSFLNILGEILSRFGSEGVTLGSILLNHKLLFITHVRSN